MIELNTFKLGPFSKEQIKTKFDTIDTNLNNNINSSANNSKQAIDLIQNLLIRNNYLKENKLPDFNYDIISSTAVNYISKLKSLDSEIKNLKLKRNMFTNSNELKKEFKDLVKAIENKYEVIKVEVNDLFNQVKV